MRPPTAPAAPAQGAEPYGGARSFGARFVTRALGKAYAGRPLTDQERHALRWANDVQRGRLIWRWSAPEQREMIEQRLGRPHGGGTFVSADAVGRTDPAEWARRRPVPRPASLAPLRFSDRRPQRRSARKAARCGGSARRTARTGSRDDGGGSEPAGDDPPAPPRGHDGGHRRSREVERPRRSDLLPAHFYVVRVIGRLTEAVTR